MKTISLTDAYLNAVSYVGNNQLDLDGWVDAMRAVLEIDGCSYSRKQIEKCLLAKKSFSLNS